MSHLIDLHLSKGYALRCAFDLLRHIISEANITFTSDAITLTQVSAGNDVMASLLIQGNAPDVSYKMNVAIDDPKDCKDCKDTKDSKGGQATKSGQEVTVFEVGIDLAEFFRAIKSVAKNDQIHIYMKEKDPKLYIKIGDPESQAGDIGANIVGTKKVNRCNYSIDEFKLSTEPDASVLSGQFSKICTNITTVNSVYALFSKVKEGITISGILAKGAMGCYNLFPRPSPPSNKIKIKLVSKTTDASNAATIPNAANTVDNDSVAIMSQLIKRISKFNSLSRSKGTVKMYMPTGLSALRLDSPVDDYATLTLIIRNNVNK